MDEILLNNDTSDEYKSQDVNFKNALVVPEDEDLSLSEDIR